MINQIIIFTRPWEVKFGVKLADSFKTLYPNTPIKFVTFFKLCSDYIHKNSNYEVYYMPSLLNNTSGLEISHEEYVQIDKKLFDCTGANINLMLNSERYLPKERNDKEIFAKKHIVVLNNIITDRTLAISSMFDHFVYWLAGGITNIKNGNYFAFCACGLPPNRTTLFKTPWETWNFKLDIKDTNLLLEDTLKLMKLPVEKRLTYMHKINKPTFRKRFIRRFIEFKYRIYDWNNGSYFVPENPYINMAKRFIKPLNPFKRKKFKYSINASDTLSNLEYKYIYCPLHYEPEAVINMFSPWMRNQIEMCRIISQALPYGVKLLVKDHPLMEGIRDNKYYGAINQISNTLLVDCRVQSNYLLENCIGVITLSGTAANEAAIMGKPSICLGRPPFRNNLQYSDFSTNFKLSDLYPIMHSWIYNDSYSVNLEDWNKWVSGLVNVSLVPKMNGVIKEIDVTDKEISILINKITSLI